MKIAVLGAGSLGSRFGAALFERGNDVVLVDPWAEHIDAIRKNGLEVIDDRERYTCQIPAFLPKECTGDFDLLLVLSKAMQTSGLLKKCRHLIHPEVKILTLQNGLGNIEIMEQFVSREQLYAGVTTYASRLIKPGIIEAIGTGYIELMQVDGRKEGGEEIAEIWKHAGMNIEVVDDVLQSIWYKAAFNCILNPLCTIMGTSVAAVGSYSKMETMINEMIEEIIKVGEAEGVKLKKSCIKQKIQEVFDPAVSGNHHSSMALDIQKGRKTEIEFLNGAIVKKANTHSISVPNNKLLYHFICMLEEIIKNLPSWGVFYCGDIDLKL
ncbi:ketopantoate reductase family protein [Salibacterium aidingense]|uniref:ketopantoate reductase family protein n=1 Tax=Salibacterium aidingense TaxID=384933 RepID=UPI003BDC1FC2